MSNATIPMDLRRVLDAPRGRRFSHTPHRPGSRPATTSAPRPAPIDTPQSNETGPTSLPPLVSLGRTPRERALLAHMPDTPGLRRRLERGDLPEWMRIAATRRAEEPDRPQPLPWWHDQVPDRAPAPDPDREPAHPLPIPRPRREQVPPPPLPRRSDRPHRPASHRKPRRRIGHLLTGYALAALAGAMAQPLITLLS
ncbi:hypothetical protein ACWGSK_07980 [Nocardiopsis sp. NPDC055551]|uniref:hypothetical protein n=1 Tax=Nocardiopsis sp. NPDC006832 TaxID=3157188 RepID=UPI0033D53C3B